MSKAYGTRARRLFGRYGRSQRGATTVEFALVIVPFLTVFLCICEAGIMLFTEYALQNATQEMGRQIRTGQISKSDGTVLVNLGDFKKRLCEEAKVIPNCTSSVVVRVVNESSFQTLLGSTLTPAAMPSSGSVTYSPGGSSRAVSVVAIYDWNFWFPPTRLLGNVQTSDGLVRRLNGLAVFRNEPF